LDANEPKFGAASFIVGGEIRTRTNKQTHTQNLKKTVNDICTPCLSACVDNKDVTVIQIINYVIAELNEMMQIVQKVVAYKTERHKDGRRNEVEMDTFRSRTVIHATAT